MKFEIFKTSEWRSENPPHPRAVLEEGLRNEPIWVIEIESLEDLISFTKGLRDGEIVISVFDPSYGKEALPALEIYDSFRE